MTYICIFKNGDIYDCTHVSIGKHSAYIRTWPSGNQQWEPRIAISPSEAHIYMQNASCILKNIEACQKANEQGPLTFESLKWGSVFARLRNIDWDEQSGQDHTTDALDIDSEDKTSRGRALSRRQQPPAAHDGNSEDTSSKKLNGGILRGVAYVIDNWLDKEFENISWHAGTEPHFAGRTAYNKILNLDGFGKHCTALIERIYFHIEANRYTHKRIPSRKNWRWEQRPVKGINNKSPEVCLERGIVNHTPPNEWCNQVPVASGYLSKNNDKGRHIDLVKNIQKGGYELVELKVEADNPFFATLEILCYGLLYIFAQNNREDFGFKEVDPIV